MTVDRLYRFRRVDAEYRRAIMNVADVRARRLLVMAALIDEGVTHQQLADVAGLARATITQQLTSRLGRRVIHARR